MKRNLYIINVGISPIGLELLMSLCSQSIALCNDRNAALVLLEDVTGAKPKSLVNVQTGAC